MNINTIPGFMSAKELRTLKYLLDRYNYEGGIGVEIGSLYGRSSYDIANTIHKGKLYCIDSWSGWEMKMSYNEYQLNSLYYPVKGSICSLENFLNNTSECKNIIPIKGQSPNVVKDWNSKIDFLFLDSSHYNPNDWDNIEFWLPKIKSGGMISGHDYRVLNSQYPDIILNINRLTQMLGQEVKNPEGTSIWYFNL